MSYRLTPSRKPKSFDGRQYKICNRKNCSTSIRSSVVDKSAHGRVSTSRVADHPRCHPPSSAGPTADTPLQLFSIIDSQWFASYLQRPSQLVPSRYLHNRPRRYRENWLQYAHEGCEDGKQWQRRGMVANSLHVNSLVKRATGSLGWHRPSQSRKRSVSPDSLQCPASLHGDGSFSLPLFALAKRQPHQKPLYRTGLLRYATDGRGGAEDKLQRGEGWWDGWDPAQEVKNCSTRVE
ncbi:hypothetical protein BDK51DRAFT_41931 [Blyttiomyces helicus]|uniref:Uncharacterized protein n=1 Tax=Blyttiomyces helicus TaxID=388810 RepID=A0A4P9VVP9_9FUNG|nr:hypothetical protein BDK51DRAFT_41931 [Blyttiomyces helicus]|eukprot:RKO83739.1 hypothetical protein BDK51DRAFT_41931 [Blyttiomyces helicus]